MRLPSIKNINVKGKRILMRVDFNVFVEKGKVKDDFRIKRTWPTVELLKKKGAKIIFISHITEGRGKSLRPVAKYLSSPRLWHPSLLKGEGKGGEVRFIADKNLNLIKKKIERMKNGEMVLLENLRLYKGEETNDKDFARNLASLADIYVNEAFSVSHRNHTSIVAITKFLPSYAGHLFEEEYRHLKKVFNPPHPFLLILGGVKFGTKLGVLERFNKIADKVFVGGALANNFFWARKIDIGKSVVDKKIDVKKFLRDPKIIVPIDIRRKGRKILDIGPLSIREIGTFIKKAKFILWNGPVGDFEVKGFDRGTMAIANLIAKSKAKSVIGGGDTVAAVKKVGLKHFTFVSTAGGSMLEFLAKGTLPGIEALKKSKK